MCKRSIWTFSRLIRKIYEEKLFIFFRRQTTATQKDPSHVINKIVAYLLQARRLLSEKFKYNPTFIIAMNETAVWAVTASTVVKATRKKEVLLKNTGHNKVRISVYLSAKVAGAKLKPFMVFGGAKRQSEALNREFGSRCAAISSPNG